MLRDVGNKVWLFKAKRMEKRGLALGEIAFFDLKFVCEAVWESRFGEIESSTVL